MDEEKIHAEFVKYQEAGIVQYVLTSEPLGEAWVIGVQGQIVKLAGSGEACAFLAGASAVVTALAAVRHARL